MLRVILNSTAGHDIDAEHYICSIALSPGRTRHEPLSSIPANHPGFSGTIPRFQHRFLLISSIPDFLALFCFKYPDFCL